MSYTLVQTIQVGSGGAASIEFTGIAGTGKDLLVLVSGRNTVVESAIGLQFNNDTANNYGYRMLYGNGSSTASEVDSFGTNRIIAYANNLSNSTTNTFNSVQYYVSNYASSLTKSVSIDGVTENNGTTAYQTIVAGRWSGTSAITSLKLTALGTGGSFAQYSTASLYIISDENASGATPSALIPKATGGTITSADGYIIHDFTSSGSFIPTQNITVEYLVVAGGGGGGGYAAGNSGAGGGGAGGYRSSIAGESSGGGASAESTLNLLAGTSYTVTIGAGGASVTSGMGNNGNNSVFSTITATAGGGGAESGTSTAGKSGGSGGGGGSRPYNSGTGAGGNGGAGTSSQGYAGGQGGATNATSKIQGGGGGGAGAVGVSYGDLTGFGGNGLTTNAKGTANPISLAGGGQAGLYDSASSAMAATFGGGQGAESFSGLRIATAGATNRGGGGGGGTGGSGGSYNTGEAGGSGRVIVRYLA